MVKWLGLWTFLIVLMVPWGPWVYRTVYAHDENYNTGAPGRRDPTRVVFAPELPIPFVGEGLYRLEVSDGKQMGRFIVDGISKSDRDQRTA